MATLVVTLWLNENISYHEIMHVIEMKAMDASEIERDSSAHSATYIQRAKKLLRFTVQFMPEESFTETLIRVF